jgi:hypothetical protein
MLSSRSRGAEVGVDVPNWLEDLNGWASIPLAVAGFLIAIRQIQKTLAAAQAAKSAAENASTQIGQNLLLLVLPQLVQIETNLEWAVARNDRDAAIHYLSAWRWQASQVRGHLIGREDTQEVFLVQLQSSIATAADTKLALQDLSADVAKRSRSVQKTIALVTGSLGELSVKKSLEGVTVGNN